MLIPTIGINFYILALGLKNIRIPSQSLLTQIHFNSIFNPVSAHSSLNRDPALLNPKRSYERQEIPQILH